MSALDTITAVATGWSPAPRALIRLSGAGVPDLLTRLFHPIPSPSSNGSAAICRTSLLLGEARTTGRSLPHTSDPKPETRNPRPDFRLPCLVLCFASPRSYTGQAAAEILLPGNPILLERVLAIFTAQPGVREAQPGEFSARAYLSGRLSLAQAEGVAQTIAARTDEGLAAAHRLMSGQTGHTYQAWADELTTLLALVEAGIDFTDQEDVVAIAPAELRARLEHLTAALRSWLGPARAKEYVADLPRIVLAGAPNAGKSTLFNALLRRRRSVESPIAGTTRDALIEELDLSDEAPGSGSVLLIDAAGLDGGGASEIDSAAQSHALEALRGADAVIHCDPTGRFADLPASSARSTADGSMPDATHRPTIRVRTKADLPQPSSNNGNIIPSDALAVCALDGWNLASLRRAIADAAWSREGSTAAPELLPRHARSLAAALAHLESAHTQTRAELIATDLREALDRLGELTGRISPDDVIGRIFATFCVGK